MWGKVMSETSVLNLFAPLSGPIVKLSDVADPVFSQKLVGDGLAIDPTSSILRAPCDGQVIQLHRARHAITIQTADGFQVLIHIGLDTVKLNGEGFSPRVQNGDQVLTGQALIEFDSDLLAQKAKSLVTIMVITEGPAHHMVLTKKPYVEAAKDSVMTMQLAESAVPAVTTKANFQQATSKPIMIHLESGLHARPAAQLVGIAKKYQSKVEVIKNGKSINAKSVVGLLSLEISYNNSIQFSAEGPDANAAVEELTYFLCNLVEQAEEIKKPLLPHPIVPQEIQSQHIYGVSASPGLAIGRIQQLQPEVFDIRENAETPTAEKFRLNRALKTAVEQIQDVSEEVKSKADAAKAAIFSAHAELMEDPDLIEMANEIIDQGKTAAFAWNQAVQQHASRLSQLNNELLRNRAADLRDVGKRVLRLLTNAVPSEKHEVFENTILIAEDLTPSDTVGFDKEKILGFCTTSGGATSHVAILARSLGIPALVGVDKKVCDIPDGTEVVLDADRGELRLNPNDEEKAYIRTLQEEQQQRRAQALRESHKPASTLDGHIIEVAANIGSSADAKSAVEMGCDGVGLLRSEFLFLERSLPPTEEEQFHVYQEIANILDGRPLTIRTLDVGGDKPLQYLPLGKEENPFLGVRGIRVGFLRPDILREQLRAILRVKSKGTINVMFPMISQYEEFILARSILEEERAKLNVPAVKVGVMIEVPSAALIADSLAQEVDFFSIGTNDLTQYTLAMDRGHQDLAKQVDALHPSVLKLIKMTVDAAHAHGKWVGVCGGLASDPEGVEILLGLGVDELSVSVPALPQVKSQIRGFTLKQAKDLAGKAMNARNAKDVRKEVRI